MELVEAVATIENKHLYASCQEAIAHARQNRQIEHLLSIPAGKLSGDQRSAVAEAFVKGMTKVTGGDSNRRSIFSNRQLNACALLITSASSPSSTCLFKLLRMLWQVVSL